MPESAVSFELVPPARFIRFGPFELDSRAGELRKHSIKIRLQHQAFQILIMLLKHPGEVVLREEICQKLWPHHTVVEFDHSINAAIQKLRDALGESADNPRYIETMPRRGYRFIGKVETAPVQPVSELGPHAPVPAVSATTPTAQTRRPRPWFMPVFTAVILLLGVLAIAGWLRPRADRTPVGNWTLSLGAVGDAVVSPDGSAVIYRTPRGLFLRRMDSMEETPVYALDRLVDTPSWSPDGSQLLFRTLSGLIRFPLPDGPPSIIWPRMGVVTRGSAWAPDGTILSATSTEKSDGWNLSLVTAKAGTPTLLEVPRFIGGRFFYPEFLPDGKNFLFAWSVYGDAEVGLYLATMEKGKLTRGPLLLRKNMTSGHYSPSGGGRLLYVENDNLYAQKLNIRRGTLEGEPERVVDGVFSAVGMHHASFSVSRNGVLVWQAGRAGLAQLTWFNRAGVVLGTAGPHCLPGAVRLSPDEKHVLLYSVADHPGYGVVESNQSGFVALPGLRNDPLWMPDSSHILYSRNDGSSWRLLERAVEGGAEKELARVPELNTLHDVSTDGKVLLYKVDGILDSIRLDGSPETAKPQMVAQTVQGRFSPDGRWVVYSAVTGSGTELYVQPFPSGGLRSQLTSTGGYAPIWRGDGREILYRNGTKICSLRVEVKDNTVHASPPETLFEVRVPAGLVGDSMPMAVTRDGSKILFAQGVEQPNPQLTYVMTAWDTLLRH